MNERDLLLTNELIDFISKSPVSYYVIKNAVSLLEKKGFKRFDPQCGKLNPGEKRFITRNGSSLLAFQLPVSDPSGFMITASHSDSPLFKLKTNYEINTGDKYCKLNTEVYGGGIFSSWFDRPLSIAGRIIVSIDNCLQVIPVAPDRDLCVIPNTCIHFNREINSGYKYNPSIDTLPLFGSWQNHSSLLSLLAEEAGVSESSIVSYDLFIYNRMQGTVFGADQEFFSSPRIDDQQCAYSTIKAFLEADCNKSIPVCAIFDNEEVGSATKQGAASDLMRDTLEMIASLYGKPLSTLLPTSLMLSCDNAHAAHPNHPELTDGKNVPYMNEGIVIKHNANQRYTTDAVSEALFTAICKKSSIPIQHFSNRSDLPGGSTLGSIANTKVSLNTIDIGLAQLAMHSSYETAGVKDTAYLIDACKSFFESEIKYDGDKSYQII